MPEINLFSSKPTAWSGKFYYEVKQNVSSNYSDIDMMVYAQKEDNYSSGTNSGKWTASITVAGTTKVLSSSGGFALSPSGCWIGSNFKGSSRQSALEYASSKGYTCTATFRVYHENDGAIDCAVSITVKPPSDTSSASGMYGQTLTFNSSLSSDDGSIPKIPRSSIIDSARDVNFGDMCQITWTPPSSTFYYKLKFSLGTQFEEVGPFCPGTTTPYSYAEYKIPNEFAKEIPSATSATMSATLYTYDDSECNNQIGSTSTATFTVSVPDNESFAPKITNCGIVVNNGASDTIKDWDAAISGHSRIDINATASGAYGAKISSFTIDSVATVLPSSGAEICELKYTSNIVTVSGRKKYVITCTDSRGKVSQQYITDEIVVLPYAPPKITMFTVTKNTKETEDVSDDRMVVTGLWSYDPVNDGERDLNSSTAVVYYKLSTTQEWTLHNGVLVNGEPFEIGDLLLDGTRSYNFKIVVTDSVGSTAQREAFSSTTTVLMDFQAGGKGLGIGKICEIDNTEKSNGSLEVSMDSYFWGGINMMGSSLFILGNEMFGTEDPNEKFAGTEPVKGQIYFKRL